MRVPASAAGGAREPRGSPAVWTVYQPRTVPSPDGTRPLREETVMTCESDVCSERANQLRKIVRDKGPPRIVHTDTLP